jgi:hypothetical protein
VAILALAMPFMTLQIMFTPATNALGRPGIALRIAMSGAVILPSAFLIGIHWGTIGIAFAWLGAFPILLAVTAAFALPVIGASAADLAKSVSPGLLAAAAMAMAVLVLDRMLPPMASQARLAILVPSGAAAYGAFLFLFARHAIEEAIAMVIKRPAPQAL